MFSKITVIVALMAASVIAAPGYGGPSGNPGPGSGSSTGSVAQDACGSSGIQSCCNVQNGQAAGVLPFSGIFASADCIPVDVPGGGVGENCNSAQATACCPVGNDNQILINAQCNQLTI